jgi:hypothetical protein
MAWKRFGNDWITYQAWTRGYYDRQEDNDLHDTHNCRRNGIVVEDLSGKPELYYTDRLGRYAPVSVCPGEEERAAEYQNGINIYCFDDGEEVPAESRWFRRDSAEAERIFAICRSGKSEAEKCVALFDFFPELRDFQIREHGRL